MMMRKHWSLALVLLACVMTRAPGLFSAVFQDEVFILNSINEYLGQRTIFPSWLGYPPLFSWLGVGPTGVCAVLGALAGGVSPTDWALLAAAFIDKQLVMGLRMLSFCFALITVWVLWWAGPKEHGPFVRTAASWVYLFSPVAIRYGSWGLLDAGMTLAITAATVLCLAYVDSPSRKRLVWAGVCVGVAGAFKYNGAIVAVACVVAAACAALPLHRRMVDLILAGAASLAVFLLLAPNWLFIPRASLDGWLFQVGAVSAPRMGHPIRSYLDPLWLLARNEPGAVVGLMMGIVAFAASNRRRLAVMWCVPLLTIAIVGRWGRQDANYWFPLLPGASLLCAEGVRVLGERLRPVLVASAVSVLLVAGYFAVGFIPYASDNYDRMSRWLAANLPAEAAVYRDGSYSPKVWDGVTKAKFIDGIGKRLSPRGRDAFEQRLAKSPRAARVIVLDEAAKGAGTDRADVIEPGAWVLTSAVPVELILTGKRPEDAEEAREFDSLRAFYRALFDGKGTWELMRKESDGQGMAQYAFRKRE